MMKVASAAVTGNTALAAGANTLDAYMLDDTPDEAALHYRHSLSMEIPVPGATDYLLLTTHYLLDGDTDY